jgi:copper transport protein
VSDIALRRSRTRAGLTTLLAAAVAAAGAPAASAHATPEGSTPASGAALHSPPASVAVRFSEPVETALGALRVYDARGAEVQAGRPFHPAGDASALAVRLRAGLRAGGYTTTFRVASTDSHPATGGFTFGVGGRAEAIGVSELLGRDGGGRVTALALAGARALQYLAIALAIGVLAVVVLVWTPVLRDLATPAGAWRAASDRFAGRARGLLLAAAAIGACSASLALALQAAAVEGVPLWSALGEAPQVLSTRFGTVWGLGALTWLAVFTIAEGNGTIIPVLRPATVGATGVALPGAGAWLPAAAVPILALALLPGLSGHAAAQHPVAVLLPANALHVLAAGAWIGGVATLVVALPAAARPLDAPERAALLARVLARFSPLALAAVCALVAGGVVQSRWELGGIGDLAGTAFGRTLAVKGLLVLGLVACGAVNRRRLIPALGRASAAGAPDARTVLILRRTLRAEVLLGVAALAASGALAGQRPGIAAARGPVSASIERSEAVRAVPTEVGPRAVSDVSAPVRSP